MSKMKKGNKWIWIASLVCTIFMSSCYSFKGISIPPDINTFYVENIENRTESSPGDLDVRFSEVLRTKIRTESRLKYKPEGADVTFEGEIVRYSIVAEAPIEGNTTALNKLEIVVQIRYQNNLNEKNKWAKSFSFFKTYDSTQDLTAIQDQLIKDIFDQLAENIFNEAFNDW